MRTETYNALRQNSLDTIAYNNQTMAAWAADPVGVGTTLTAQFSDFTNETVEFLKFHIRSNGIHTDIIAKLDELHGV